jgi:hypothetical protein
VHHLVRTYVDEDTMQISRRQSVHYLVRTYVNEDSMLISSRQSVHYLVRTYVNEDSVVKRVENDGQITICLCK